MSLRTPDVYLQDILESAQLIRNYLQGVSEEEFYQSSEKQDAVLRRLEIIGEAVKQLPDEILQQEPDIPWRQIAGIRDIIIHEYFGVTLEMIWVVATEDIPDLMLRITQIIGSRK